MDPRQRSNTGFEERDPPPAEVVPVRGQVSRLANVRPATPVAHVHVVPDMVAVRVSRLVAMAAAAFILAFALGDDGPWIIVVPGLTALGAAWLDRRIAFSFAEGLVGYRSDAEPLRGVLEEDVSTASQRSAPAPG